MTSVPSPVRSSGSGRRPGALRRVAVTTACALAGLIGFVGFVGMSGPAQAEEPLGVPVDPDVFPTPTVEPPEAPIPHGTRVRFGILQFEAASSYRANLDNVQDTVVAYLQKRAPQLTIEAIPYHSSGELKAAVRNNQVEFFLASSGLFVEMQPYGVRDIGTLTAPAMPDPNQCVAGVMVVRSDRDDLTDIESLAGKRAVSTDRENFMTYQTNLGEIAKAGFDPDDFFSSVAFTKNSPEQVLRDVAEGRADVGLLRACMPEALEAKNPQLAGRFKVINAQAAPAGKRLGCAFSTALYPGWTIAVANHTPAAITRHLAVALLELSPGDTPGGYTVSFTTNFESVTELFRKLRIGPFEHLRHWTVERIVQTYWPFLMLLLMGVLGWIWHSWRLERLVVKRTAALSESMGRERAASEAARRTAEKLNQLERVGMIGRLSSVFAHEFVQPLSAMRYHARSIRKLSEREELNRPLMAKCIDGLTEQLELAASIIDRVRRYAKGGADRSAAIDLAALARDVVREMAESKKLRNEVAVTAPADPVMTAGDAVELRVLIMNLLKNADEAQCASGVVSAVTLTLTAPKEGARMTVANGGRRLTAHELARITEPLASTKTEGLGLGLLLCKSIAEVHRAKITFDAREAGGIVVTVAFPKMTETAKSDDAAPSAPSDADRNDSAEANTDNTNPLNTSGTHR